ncbi:hypothetical protein K0M31_005518 [Melipona bicolor]|uniref:Uncharacterized protein n=1 Tax=Melipona bicolor TaxID=60889 RepID=A0AA40KMK3_9HYME|nr:hypothetical protein K0M31_005518 [Melipona bicolor]
MTGILIRKFGNKATKILRFLVDHTPIWSGGGNISRRVEKSSICHKTTLESRVGVCIPTSHYRVESDVFASPRTRRFASARKTHDDSTFNDRKRTSTHSNNLTDAMFRLTAPPLT